MVRSLLLALCLLALLPGAAQAHAILEESSPARGAQLERPPERVAFAFNEPVEAAFGAVRVYNAAGDEVGQSAVVRPGGRRDAVGVALAPDLAAGTYTATYRVISADGHPVEGGLVFTVAEGGPPPAATLSEILDEGQAGAVTQTAFGAVRAVGYAAIALGVGGLVFLLAVWVPALGGVAGAQAGWAAASERFAGALGRLLVVAVAAGVLCGLAALVLQGAIAGGTSAWAALSPGVLGEVLQTRFGEVTALRTAGWLVFAGLLGAATARGALRVLRPATLGATGLAPAPPLRPGLGGALLVSAGLLVVTVGLGGHAGSTDPVWLVLGAASIHVAAMALWLGGLTVLLVAVPRATRALEGADRSRLLAGVVERFSTLALACVAALLISGVVQSVVHLSAVADLWETGFGRAIAVKIALLAGLIALGALNRQRVRPALRRLTATREAPGRPGVVLRRALRGEVALLAAVLGVTAALASYAPAATGADLLATTTQLGPARVDLTVEPLSPGPLEVHLYLFDRTGGAPFEAFDGLEATMRLPEQGVGPLDVALERAGPGHLVAPAAPVSPSGDWELALQMRESRFDVHNAVVEVEIR